MHGRYKTEIATLVIQSSNGPFSRGADPPFRPPPERPPFPLTAAALALPPWAIGIYSPLLLSPQMPHLRTSL